MVSLLVVLALLAGGGTTYLVMRESGRVPASAGVTCGPGIDVAAAPEIADAVRAIVTDAGCEQMVVTALPPAQVSQQVRAGKDEPDVWIPDSSSWVARAAAGAPATPRPLLASLASSPVVLASAAGAAPATWSAALADPGLVMGDPLTSVAAAVPLLGAATDAADAEEAAALAVPLAQGQADADAVAPPEAERLAELAAAGRGLTAVSEQLVLRQDAGVTMAAPSSGTLLLDYPVLLTTSEERRADIEPATTRLVELLEAPAAQDVLRAAGFRGPDGAPLERGVGAITPLKVAPEQVTATLTDWARLAMPTRALAVIDVSGSMDFDAGGSTRMELTTAATRSGLDLFPDAAAIGLWAFSEKLDGEVDHRPLVPIRRLGAAPAGQSQRAALARSLDALPDLTGGGTGLYDTTLAAYRAVLEDHDPRAMNSVLLFTDGANDDPGSIGLHDLLAELRALADPARPVRIIAIGVSADADAKALRTIARATGGEAYVAEQPEDMATVFRQALAARPG